MMYSLFIQLSTLFLNFFFDSLIINYTGSFFLQSVMISTLIIFLKNRSIPFLFFSFLLLGIESFFIYDIFGLTYLYLIPTFYTIYCLDHYFNFKRLTPYFSVFLLITVHTLFISSFKLESAYSTLYLLSQIGVNLIMLYISLKWLSIVK